MSTKAGGTDHLFLFTYANNLLWDIVLVLIFIIYFFTSSKRCQQQQRKSPPVFIYLCKLLLVTHCFHFNIQYLFVYLFKAMSTKAAGTHHLFLFTYANHFLITCAFHFNIEYLFVYLFKTMSTTAGATEHLYLLIEIGWCDFFLEIHVYNRTTFGTNYWRTLGKCCKIPIFKQREEIKWMSRSRPNFSVQYFQAPELQLGEINL